MNGDARALAESALPVIEMKFLFGVLVGAVGLWAYRSGKLETLTGRSPASVQEAFSVASDRVKQVAEDPRVGNAVAKVQDAVSTASSSTIGRPSQSEVAGPTDQPLPGTEPGNQ